MPKAADPLPTFPATGVRLRRGAADYLLGFWRARGLMLAVFALALILAMLAASALPRGETATTAITVNPASALLEERALLVETSEVAIGDPEAFRIQLGASPETLVATYQASDAARAEAGLGAILRAYRAMRSAPEGNGGPDAQQIALQQAEAALAAFRRDNETDNPEAEALAMSRAYEQAERETEALAARRQEAELRLAAYQARLDVFDRDASPASRSDTSALAALRRQRAELSLRYREGSQTLRDMDELILRQEAHLQAAGAAETEPAPDPARRLAEAERAAARRELAAILAREQQVEDRLVQIEAQRAAKLSARAQYRRLFAAYQQAVDTAARAAPSRALPELAFGEIVTEARGLPLVPTGIAAVLSALAAALIAGLMRVFAETALATPASVTRSLGLPVLAAVAER